MLSQSSHAILRRLPRNLPSCRLGLRSSTILRSSSTRTSSNFTPFANEKFDSPLDLINEATSALEDFVERLNAVQDTISTSIELPSGQQVTMRDIVLHSRDADPTAFHQPAARDARSIVLPRAESVEGELRELSQFYTERLAPHMEQAMLICRDTPCGGATWELDLSSSRATSTDTQIRVEQEETPCGRLHRANMDFLEQTYHTKGDVLLGSRAALLLRLAQELNAPLSEIRNQGGDKKKRIGQVFSTEKVPTPWVRSDEEYQQFFKLKEEVSNADSREN